MNRKDTSRKALSVYQMSEYVNADKSEEEKAYLPRDFFEYKPRLYSELIVPSYVHGYSLAIEYMRNWFLNKFEDKNYFKSITVNGRHVLDEWKHFNEQVIKREKPMLAIIPTVEYDHDRDLLDNYQADRRILLHRSNYQQSFFKDWEHMHFLYARPREIKMNFTFKIRVGSKAEQLDLWQKMELYFRIGATETNHISADLHIPHELMTTLAKRLGFSLTPDGEVKEAFEFISYCNKHSDVPIIFKMRAINQRPEYFMRQNNLGVHILTKDKIQPDEGEKEGRIDTNYHLEFQAVVTMIVPHFFVLFSQDPIEHKVSLGHDAIGVCTINSFEIPPANKRGWNLKVQTDCLCEVGDKYIDLSPIFSGRGNMNEVMKYNLQNHISPDSFIEVCVFHSRDGELLVRGFMDYTCMQYRFDTPIEKEEAIVIAVYGDDEYINETIVSINNYQHTRIDKPEA